MSGIAPSINKEDTFTEYKVQAERIDKWFWPKWIIAILVFYGIHLSTITVAPFSHKDELLIVDLGRIILNPDTDWSIAWLGVNDQPALFFCYLGTVLQEFAFRLAGDFGPRISALTGALLAATMMVCWLREKGVSPNLTLILGLVFLLDPIFVQSYSLARVDSWMMASCLGACTVLANTANEGAHMRDFVWRLLFAGALTCIAFFIWPTAIFYFPLLLLELLALDKQRSHRRIWQVYGYFSIGALILGVILLMPVFSLIYNQPYSLKGMEVNIGTGITKSANQLIGSLIEIFRVLKFTPILFLATVYFVFRQRQIGLLIALMVLAIVMIMTKVYIHRVQYLLPYFIAAVAGVYRLDRNLRFSFHSGIRKSFLVVLLGWSVGVSIIARYMLANEGKEERKNERVYEAAQAMVGKGQYAVYSTFEFYYPGRSFGWKMYIPYDETLSAKSLSPILAHVDYAIFRSNEVTGDIAELLENNGMVEKVHYNVYDSLRSADSDRPSTINKVRNLFSVFRKPYGPYKFYVRKPVAGLASRVQ
jgi:hypothetical protein